MAGRSVGQLATELARLFVYRATREYIQRVAIK